MISCADIFQILVLNKVKRNCALVSEYNRAIYLFRKELEKSKLSENKRISDIIHNYIFSDGAYQKK
jgi:hypothetical protein